MGRGKDFERRSRRNFEQDEPTNEPAWSVPAPARRTQPPPLLTPSTADRYTGTVKRFDTVKRFGFIKPDDGATDVFVHVSAVKRAGLAALEPGQLVEYELTSDRGKLCADKLTIRSA